MLLVETHDSCGGLLHFSRACVGEKQLFTVALDVVVKSINLFFLCVCLSGVKSFKNSFKVEALFPALQRTPQTSVSLVFFGSS